MAEGVGGASHRNTGEGEGEGEDGGVWRERERAREDAPEGSHHVEEHDISEAGRHGWRMVRKKRRVKCLAWYLPIFPLCGGKKITGATAPRSGEQTGQPAQRIGATWGALSPAQRIGISKGGLL